MTYLPSLPEGAVLLDVFRAYPETARPLMDYHQALMRGSSPLSLAERELIAAYVSGLNAYRYCHGVHAATAQAFGIGAGTLGALLADVGAAPVAERRKPLRRNARKLTLNPGEDHPGGRRGGAGGRVGGAGAARRRGGVRAVQPHEPAGRRARDHRG